MRTFFVLPLLSLALICTPALSHEVSQPRRQISVEGQASRYVAPDLADIHLSVEGRSSDSGTAMQEAGNAAQAVVDTLQQFVDARQVRASQTNVRSVVKGTNNSWYRESGAAVEMLATRTIDLQRLPVDKLAAVMKALAAHKLATVDNVELKVSNASEVESEMVLLALDDAKARATAMAKRLGVELGLPISVHSNQQYAPQPKMMVRAMAMEMDGAGGGYSAAGENEINAHVSVVFELNIR